MDERRRSTGRRRARARRRREGVTLRWRTWPAPGRLGRPRRRARGVRRGPALIPKEERRRTRRKDRGRIDGGVCFFSVSTRRGRRGRARTSLPSDEYVRGTRFRTHRRFVSNTYHTSITTPPGPTRTRWRFSHSAPSRAASSPGTARPPRRPRGVSFATARRRRLRSTWPRRWLGSPPRR